MHQSLVLCILQRLINIKFGNIQSNKGSWPPSNATSSCR